MKFWKLIPIMLLLVVFTACKKSLTDDLENRTVSQGYYDSAQKIEEAVVGGYVDLRRALLSNYGWLMYGEARTGDLNVAVDYQPAVLAQKLTTADLHIQQLTDWGYFYDVIHDANDVLDIVNKSKSGVLTNYQRNLYKGEALALKSMAYFYLARIWGNVPSAESGDFGKRLTGQQVVTLAATWAAQAKLLLPWQLNNSDGIESAGLTAIRFSRTSATMLLSQEQLWLGKNQDAYTLLTTTFTTSVADSLSTWNLSLGKDRRTDIPQTPLDANVVNLSIDKLNEIYPTGDSRRTSMFTLSADGKSASLIVGDATLFELLPVREINLLLAEAAWRSNRLDEAKTALIEAAAGATEDYTTLTSTTFADALLTERRRMLMGTGQRVFDLIRFGKVPAFIPVFTDADVQKGAAYWPLSASSIQGNSLSQNSYWLSKN